MNAVQKVSLTQSEKVKQLVYPSKTESFPASQGNMKKKKEAVSGVKRIKASKKSFDGQELKSLRDGGRRLEEFVWPRLKGMQIFFFKRVSEGSSCDSRSWFFFFGFKRLSERKISTIYSLRPSWFRSEGHRFFLSPPARLRY